MTKEEIIQLKKDLQKMNLLKYLKDDNKKKYELKDEEDIAEKIIAKEKRKESERKKNVVQKIINEINEEMKIEDEKDEKNKEEEEKNDEESTIDGEINIITELNNISKKTKKLNMI